MLHKADSTPHHITDTVAQHDTTERNATQRKEQRNATQSYGKQDNTTYNITMLNNITSHHIT